MSAFDWDAVSDLPGAALVQRGVEARARGEQGVEALLVSLASRRLGRAGLAVPVADLPAERELALVGLLERSGEGNVHSRYNALRRELDSFLSALSRRMRT